MKGNLKKGVPSSKSTRNHHTKQIQLLIKTRQGRKCTFSFPVDRYYSYLRGGEQS